MGLIADECPRCKRVTRCLVFERGGFVGGVVLGIPFALPLSTVQCVCGECGHEFQSPSVAEDRAVPPEVAAGLDTDTLLARYQPRPLAGSETFRASGGSPASRRVPPPRSARPRPALPRAAVRRSPVASADEPDREDLLRRVEACARADAFARAIAGRYTMGTAGCVAGVVLAVGVWTVAGLTVGHLDAGGWVMVGVAGLAAGGVPSLLLLKTQGRRWVREVLLPKAEGEGVSPEWVLAVLEGTAPPRGAEDDLSRIREIARH